MEALFWASFGVVLYVYVGYPLVLAVWARLARRERQTADDLLPPVSIILAVRNEAPRLPERLENLRALDYPAELLEIIVVSDGSTDRTAEVLAPHTSSDPRRATAEAPRIRLIEVARNGKAAALNAGVAAARHGDPGLRRRPTALCARRCAASCRKLCRRDRRRGVRRARARLRDRRKCVHRQGKRRRVLAVREMAPRT